MNLQTVTSKATIPSSPGHLQKLSIYVKNARFGLGEGQTAPPELYQAKRLWMQHKQTGDPRPLQLCIDLVESLLHIAWDWRSVQSIEAILADGNEAEMPAKSITIHSVWFGAGPMPTIKATADFEVRFFRPMTQQVLDAWMAENDDFSWGWYCWLDGPDGDSITLASDEGIHVELPDDQYGPGSRIGRERDRGG